MDQAKLELNHLLLNILTLAKTEMKANCIAICAVAVLLLVANANVSEAACNPNDLAPCAPAIVGGAPSSLCCTKMKSQKPCFCQYAKDPRFSSIVNSPGAKKVASACGVSFPKC
ncbi:OLC1v1014132C1 [Oldenlandia corymbosa var. corymbosa]|uniref:OLC1v1014132C1 n=1 Tax=Oldenlandia corymbosa var. corymbosa TaxID=529605 RepID=A0AAV1E029_OLDCO|nr:OLC1v1014132C1 [Oldenlandia corymbosa var. corymbosa]